MVPLKFRKYIRVIVISKLKLNLVFWSDYRRLLVFFYLKSNENSDFKAFIWFSFSPVYLNLRNSELFKVTLWWFYLFLFFQLVFSCFPRLSSEFYFLCPYYCTFLLFLLYLFHKFQCSIILSFFYTSTPAQQVFILSISVLSIYQL